MWTARRAAVRRFLAIDARLREDAAPNARTLAQELEVSNSTVERDIRFMRDQLYAPIVYNPSRRGYEYEEPFALTHLDLDRHEVMALYLAQKVVEQFKGTPHQEHLARAYQKILAAATEKGAAQIPLFEQSETVVSIDLREPRGDEELLLPWLSILEASARHRTSVDLTYYTMSRHAESERRVDPYNIRLRGGAWYLIGYCYSRRDVRIFAVDRIRELARTHHSFTVRPGYDPETFLDDVWGIYRGKPANVELRFAPEIAAYIEEREWHSNQELTREEDGSVHMSLRVRGLPEVRGFVLRFGSLVEVLAPDELRDTVRREAEAMVEMYGG